MNIHTIRARDLPDLWFQAVHDILDHGSERYIPRKFLYLLMDRSISRARAVADCIASLTEAEALQLHGRLRGYASGSVLDPIVR